MFHATLPNLPSLWLSDILALTISKCAQRIRKHKSLYWNEAWTEVWRLPNYFTPAVVMINLKRYPFEVKNTSNVIKALTTLVGRLSLKVGCENGPERGLKAVSLKRLLPVILANSADPDQMPRSVASDLRLRCLPISQSRLDNHLYIALWRAAVKIRFLDFVLCTVWLHWSVIITPTTTLRKFWRLYTMARL